jgi:hypothetical protein
VIIVISRSAVAARTALDESQLPICGKLPTTKTFYPRQYQHRDRLAPLALRNGKPSQRSSPLTSPYVVVASSENTTDTCCAVGTGIPTPIAPVCTAIACRGSMVTLKLPPYPTENLQKNPHTLYERAYTEEDVTYAVPLQIPALLGPSITLQYDPAGKPVANVALHSVSRLLMATKPTEPV